MDKVFLLLVAVLLTITPCHALNFTFISDIHFDPLYGTENAYGKCITADANPMGESGCDAPLALVESALNDISSFSDAFTIFGGDWQRHDFPAANISTTTIFNPLSKAFAEVNTSGFPTQETVDIAVTLGNDDFIKDYFFNYTAPNQSFLAEQITVMETNKILSTAEGDQMKTCGFYSTTSNGFRVITFNAFLWTYVIIPSIADDVEDPCGQFAYMESELSDAAANGDKVVLLGHVPPSVNGYDVISRGKMTTVDNDMYWKSWYLTRYLALLKKYNTTVVTHLYGHIHVFAILAFEEAGVPGFVIPSISPVFGNNANYLIASFSDSWNLEGLRQRYFSANETWTDGLDVGTALGGNISFESVDDFRQTMTSMFENETLFMNYLTIRGGGYDPYFSLPGHKCDEFCRSLLICSALYMNYTELSNCTNTYTAILTASKGSGSSSTSLSKGAIGGIVAAIVIVVGVVFGILLYRALRRKRKAASNMDYAEA